MDHLAKTSLEMPQFDRIRAHTSSEINNAIDYGLIAASEVVDFLKNKPAELHVLLTGRNAKPEIIELADTVTEMREVKHAFHKGIIAQKGIEY